MSSAKSEKPAAQCMPHLICCEGSERGCDSPLDTKYVVQLMQNLDMTREDLFNSARDICIALASWFLLAFALSVAWSFAFVALSIAGWAWAFRSAALSDACFLASDATSEALFAAFFASSICGWAALDVPSLAAEAFSNAASFSSEACIASANCHILYFMTSVSDVSFRHLLTGILVILRDLSLICCVMTSGLLSRSPSDVLDLV